MSVKRKVNYANGYAVTNVNDIVYQHFNQPDHSILSMRVRIIEKKIDHRTNNPNLATSLRRQKEDYWIRELGTVLCTSSCDSDNKTVSSVYKITNSFK